MGMYTELILSCRLKKQIPRDLIYTIATLVNQTNVIDALPNDCKMLYNIDDLHNPLVGDCYYFVPGSYAKFWYDTITHSYCLMSRSAIKNHNNEIEKFLELIKPYIDQGSGALNTYAYVHYEEDDEAKVYSLREKGE
jgi:hypothetical protein